MEKVAGKRGEKSQICAPVTAPPLWRKTLTIICLQSFRFKAQYLRRVFIQSFSLNCLFNLNLSYSTSGRQRTCIFQLSYGFLYFLLIQLADFFKGVCIYLARTPSQYFPNPLNDFIPEVLGGQKTRKRNENCLFSTSLPSFLLS